MPSFLAMLCHLCSVCNKGEVLLWEPAIYRSKTGRNSVLRNAVALVPYRNLYSQHVVYRGISNCIL